MAQYAIVSKTPQLTTRMKRDKIEHAMMWLVWNTSSMVQALPRRDALSGVLAMGGAELYAKQRRVPCKVEVAEGYSVSVERVEG